MVIRRRFLGLSESLAFPGRGQPLPTWAVARVNDGFRVSGRA